MPPEGQSVVDSSAASDWGKVHGVILRGHTEGFFDYGAPFPIVVFCLLGTTAVEWRRGGRFSRFLAKPGDVLVLPPASVNSLRMNLPTETFTCPVGLDLLRTIIEREWPRGASTFEVVESFNRRDEELWNLGRRLATRVVSPTPGYRTCAEALLTQIALHLLWNYSTLSRPGEAQDDRPADQRLRNVVDYIRSTLAEDLSLETLADVAGLSPNYFLGAFKQATGRTPHQFVIEQRVARACELLHDPHRPISEVSLAAGFSSQSHLTEVFRRFMKTTPAAYRKEVLGRVPNANGRPPGGPPGPSTIPELSPR
jgi:AraC family transcriptional regulator